MSLKYRVQKLRTKFKITIIVAICISVYSLYVEVRTGQNATHKPLCDISESISCSKAFNSKFGKGFGLLEYIFGKDSIINQPNSFYGIIFYSFLWLLDEIYPQVWGSYNKYYYFEEYELSVVRLVGKIQLFLAVLSNCVSIYLAFVLIFIQYNLCVLCVSIYVFNILLLYYVHHKIKLLREISSKRQQNLMKAYSIIKNNQPK